MTDWMTERVCFVSILRVPKLWRNEQGLDLNDFTYATVELGYLTSVEVNGAIICASVMTLKPFVARFFPGLLGSLQSGGLSDPNRDSDPGGARGPPTIGSMPSKMPLSPAESELMGKIGGSTAGSSATSRGYGYADIDEWEVDVEMAEGISRENKGSISSKSEETKVEVNGDSDR